MHACSAGSFIGRSELHISPMPFGHLFGWVSAAGKLLIQRRQVAMLSAERRICPGARAGGRREKGHALGVVVRPGSRDFSSSRTSSVCVRWAQLEPGAGRCGSIGAWLATPHHSTAPRWCGVVTRAGRPAVAMPRASSPIDSIPARAARPDGMQLAAHTREIASWRACRVPVLETERKNLHAARVHVCVMVV